MAYRFKIATDAAGTNYWEFTMNPTDIAGLFQARAYSRRNTLGGMAMRQFPSASIDNRLKVLDFDGIPDSSTSLTQFLMGITEDDNESLQYLKKLDSNGRLTVYYLMIPDDVKQYRPDGYRTITAIPIQVEDVINEPRKGPNGIPRWHCRMIFSIVPLAQVPLPFTLGTSRLDSQNQLVSGAYSAVYYYDDSLGTYTEYTDEAFAGDSPFPASMDDSDLILLGVNKKFYGGRFYMETVETIAPDEEQGDTANTWEYYNGSTWVGISTTDDTDSFTKADKAISWSTLTNWADVSLADAIVGAPATDEYYWVRLTVGTITTAWSIDRIWRL